MATPFPNLDPKPVPPDLRVIKLPNDQYLHHDPEKKIKAPTEWWWHIGTLVSGSRVFGFDINAAAFYPYGFTQVSLSDVANNIHYKQSTPVPEIPDGWAENDIAKPWYVGLENVRMAQLTPTVSPSDGMLVEAKLIDESKGGAEVSFSLTMRRQGPPFMVWGTGVAPYRPPFSVLTHNYYYSLTRLETRGTVSIKNGKTTERLDVLGTTWMDHEYGTFGDEKTHAMSWFWQGVQLENGIHLANYVVFDKDNPPQLGKPAWGQVTVQYPNDETFFVDSILTPVGRTWRSPTGTECFMQFRIEIPDFGADLRINTLMDDQELSVPGLPFATYEGVATVEGAFKGQGVRGTAWNEQNRQVKK
jgi:predicted secreted hydrolase